MEVLVAAWCGLCLAQLLLWNGRAAGQQQDEPRPLWILDDGLAKRQRLNRPEADYATTTRQPLLRRQARGGQEPGPITFLVRHQEEDMEMREPSLPARRRMPSTLPQRRFMMPHRLQLPHQYVQPNQRIRSSASGSSSRSSHRRTGTGRHLPVFDNAPGENTLRTGRDNYPIFVYNGTRGELILNTMLSRRRYPMQEPVPGQVLYPPSTPMFRPKPIVERFRLPGQREMLNLTLIPFYAHEAIAQPSQAPTSSTTQATPPPPPAPLYETQLPRSQELELGKRKRKQKKAKQYEAFHSPQEVMQWQSVLRRHVHEHDRDNHRHYSSEESRQPLQQEQQQDQDQAELQLEHEEEHEEEEDWVADQETETELELPPEPETETSTSPSSAPFQIVYLDDSLERPVTSSSSGTTTTTTTTDPPPTLRQSSRYALKREYYAFPVYTLGKLLQPQARQLLEKSDRAARSSLEARRGPNTWFILNSRYKGPHHRTALGADSQTKYYTSKYMESGFRPRR